MDRLVPPDKIKYDSFGHPKLEPEILAYALRQALSDYIGVKMDVIASKPLTYHLRDGNLSELDDKFARMTAEECVRLIDQGDFGRVATIQDPEVSGVWPEDRSLQVNTHGKILVVSSVPLEIASRIRTVDGTGFFDYNELRPTPQFTDYLHPLLGPKSLGNLHNFVPFKLAEPVGAELSNK